MTRTPARLHPSLGDGGLAGDSTRRAFLKGAGMARAAVYVWHYPGWHEGRTTHIHVKVHVTGKVSSGVHRGGHTSHGSTRQLNGTDQVHAGQRGTSSIVRLTPVRRGAAAKGYYGTITLGATPEAVGR